MSYVRRFLGFLYDFLVGDAWELFVGPLAGLFVAWLLIQLGASTAIAGGVLFAGVLIVVVAHLILALRQSS